MEKSNKFQFINAISISFAHMIHDIYASFLAPILPLLIEKLSISYSMIGLLSVISRIPSLFNPFFGLIADKLSVRYFIVFAPSITTISMSLLGLAPNVLMLAILLLIMGISSSLFHVPSPVMIKQVSGDRIGKGMSFFMLGGEVARTIAPLTILGAVSLWGLEGTWRLIPFGVISSMILFVRIRKIKISDKFKKDSKSKQGIKTTLKIISPVFLPVAGFIFCRAFMKGSLTIFLPLYLNTEGGETLWVSGIYLTVIQCAGAVGTIFSGTFSDKIGRKNILLFVSFLSPVLMWLFIIMDRIYTGPLLIIIGLVLFSTGPVLLAVVNNLNTDRPSFVNGIYITVNFITDACAALFLGILGDLLGLETTFKISALIACVGIPFVLKLKQDKNRAF